jgi:PAS domain S-box-containing protein
MAPMTDSPTREAAFFRQAAAGMAETDAQGRFVDVNARYCEITGRSREELLSLSMQAITHADDLPENLRLFAAALESGEPFEIEKRYVRPDGSEVWVLNSITPLRDEAGSISGAACVTIDLSARRTAEEQLRRNRDTFHRLIQNNPFGIYVVDSRFRLVEASLGARKVFENVDQPIGSDLAEVLRVVWPEPFASEAIARFRHTLASGEPHLAPSTVEQRADIDAVAAYDWRIERIELPDGEPGVVCYFYELSERLRLEAAVREASERVELALDTGAVAGTWVWDVANDRFTADERFAKSFSLDPAACREGLPLAVVKRSVHPDDQGRVEQLLAEAMSRGGAYRAEYRVRRADDCYYWVEAVGRCDLGPGGEPVRFPGVLVDIDARKRDEAALRESEARLRALTDHLPTGVVYQMVTDRDGGNRRFVYVSQSHAGLTGIETEAVLADATLPYRQIVPEHRPLLAQAEADSVRDLSPFNVQVQFRRPDGELRWIRIASAPRVQADGSLIWDGLQIDVTEQVLAEDVVRERELWFHGIVNSIDQMIWSTRPDGYHDFYNERWYEFTGVPSGSTEGEGWAGMFHPEDQERAWAIWRRSLETGEPYHIEYRLRHRSGAYRWVLGRAQPLRDDSGAIVRWFGTCTDIEEIVAAREVLTQSREELERQVRERSEQLIRAQEALAQAQKMEAVGQLTGGIAHDFNNLLQGVAGSFDLIRRKPDDRERVLRWADAGLRAAERGAKLTGQLLAFSRAQKIQVQPLLVPELVDGMRELLDRTLGPMVNLKLAMEPGSAPVCSDPTQLEMAVLNLAINARDAMPLGGDLRIATRTISLPADAEIEAGDYLELSVTDTGSGMAPEVAARAFDPFFTTKGIGKGTGLGLSQVYGIARQAQGTARIESRPGEGTSVRLLLRHVDASVTAGDAGAASDRQLTHSGAKVLIIDDDPDVRRFLVDSLESLGYRIAEASDGPAGLDLLERFEPDLLLVDFAMPGMTGAEVAKAARQVRPALPIVFASGYADTFAIEEAAGDEALILRKPFRVGELNDLLSRALERAGPGGGSR